MKSIFLLFISDVSQKLSLVALAHSDVGMLVGLHLAPQCRSAFVLSPNVALFEFQIWG